MEKSQKLTSGQKAIVTVGAFVITFISVCAFFNGDIKFLLTSKSVERKFGKTVENSYFIEDNFIMSIIIQKLKLIQNKI